MNPTPIAEALGTTLEHDASPFVGQFAAFAIAIAFMIAIGWALFYWHRRRVRLTQTDLRTGTYRDQAPTAT